MASVGPIGGWRVPNGGRIGAKKGGGAFFVCLMEISFSINERRNTNHDYLLYFFANEKMAHKCGISLNVG